MTRQVLMMMSISILNIFYTRCTKVYTLDCLLNQSRIDCPVRVDRGIPFLHLLLLVSCLKHTRFRQMISQSLSSCFLIHSLTIFLSFFKYTQLLSPTHTIFSTHSDCPCTIRLCLVIILFS